MNKDQVEGAARNVGGRVQEATGSVFGDAKLRAVGAANQAAGSFQGAVGDAREAAVDAF